MGGTMVVLLFRVWAIGVGVGFRPRGGCGCCGWGGRSGAGWGCWGVGVFLCGGAWGRRPFFGGVVWVLFGAGLGGVWGGGGVGWVGGRGWRVGCLVGVWGGGQDRQALGPQAAARNGTKSIFLLGSSVSSPDKVGSTHNVRTAIFPNNRATNRKWPIAWLRQK